MSNRGHADGSSSHDDGHLGGLARREEYNVKAAQKVATTSRNQRVCFALDTLEKIDLSMDGAPVVPFLPSSVDKQRPKHVGFRGDYVIGELLRARSHLDVAPTHRQALAALGSLQQHDFAFVRRSDGSFSYAILAYRHVAPMKGAEGRSKNKPQEECMTFVMSERGTTKMVRKRFWSEFVRLVRVSPSDPHQIHSERPVSCQEIVSDQNLFPPIVIAYVPPDLDEDCSLLSSVSDRARGR